VSIDRARTRTLTGLAIGAASLMLVAACGDSSSTSTGTSTSLPKTIVFSPISLQPPALKGLSEGLKGYAGSKGWDVVIQDPNFNASKQVQALTEVISSGRAGAAWVIAVAPAALKPLLATAKGKGIPVLVNGKPEEYGFSGPQPGITFDYIDYTAAGTATGEQTGKCITEKSGGKAKVLWLQQPQGQAGKAEFDAAAKAALLAAAPDAEIVQTLQVAERAKGQTDVGAALQGHPDITAVMAQNDEAGLGAIGAFKAAGKELPCLVDFGGSKEVLDGVKSGSIFASVALQFEADLAQSFDTLAAMQSDPKAAGKVLTVPQKIITAAG
jgi:ABC-type sugar transport system substrate-binding protein